MACALEGVMKIHRPLRAMRLFCLDCCGGSVKEVRHCTANRGETPCTIWPYRMGKRPKRTQSRSKTSELGSGK